MEAHFVTTRYDKQEDKFYLYFTKNLNFEGATFKEIVPSVKVYYNELNKELGIVIENYSTNVQIAKQALPQYANFFGQ